MPIVTPAAPDLLDARDNLIASIGFLIQDAQQSADDIDPWTLAGHIVDTVEDQLAAIEEGAVICRN